MGFSEIRYDLILVVQVSAVERVSQRKGMLYLMLVGSCYDSSWYSWVSIVRMLYMAIRKYDGLIFLLTLFSSYIQLIFASFRIRETNCSV